MRLWFKIWKDARLKEELTVEVFEGSRTRRVFDALEQASEAFNLSVPIWLDKNIKDFKKFSRCRFNADNYIESIDFDHLEMIVLDEDWVYEE